MIQKKIALALGGGGARGLAHVGVLKHFESQGFCPDILSGTSAGAIVASLYAFNHPLSEIISDIEQLRPAKFSAFKFNQLGLFENENLKDMLQNALPENPNIEDSPIPLAIQATDIETGSCVVMTKGNLIDAILASCCVPGIYLPQKINGHLLVDGGLTENVPISGAKQLQADIIIGVDLNGNERYKAPENVLDVISNSLDIAIDNQTKNQLKGIDVIISMDLTHFSRFQVEKAQELLVAGEQAANKAFKSSEKLQFRHRVRKVKKRFQDFSPIKIPEIIKRRFRS